MPHRWHRPVILADLYREFPPLLKKFRSGGSSATKNHASAVRAGRLGRPGAAGRQEGPAGPRVGVEHEQSGGPLHPLQRDEEVESWPGQGRAARSAGWKEGEKGIFREMIKQ